MPKFATIATCAAAMVFSVPAMAQGNGNSAPTAPAPAAKSHYSTQTSTIGALLADPAAKAVVDAHLPGLSASPSIGMASGMTLRDIQPMAGDKISVQALDAIDVDLSKIPAK